MSYCCREKLQTLSCFCFRCVRRMSSVPCLILVLPSGYQITGSFYSYTPTESHATSYTVEHSNAISGKAILLYTHIHTYTHAQSTQFIKHKTVDTIGKISEWH